jgi:hypothetical protein
VHFAWLWLKRQRREYEQDEWEQARVEMAPEPSTYPSWAQVWEERTQEQVREWMSVQAAPCSSTCPSWVRVREEREEERERTSAEAAP